MTVGPGQLTIPHALTLPGPLSTVALQVILGRSGWSPHTGIPLPFYLSKTHDRFYKNKGHSTPRSTIYRDPGGRGGFSLDYEIFEKCFRGMSLLQSLLTSIRLNGKDRTKEDSHL